MKRAIRREAVGISQRSLLRSRCSIGVIRGPGPASNAPPIRRSSSGVNVPGVRAGPPDLDQTTGGQRQLMPCRESRTVVGNHVAG
jgi:hypothetical protein